MTLHVLGFAHTSLTPEYASCAFTDRTRTFAAMMREHMPVTTYGGPEGSDVALVTREEQATWWPWYSPSGHAVYNDFSPDSPGWVAFNARAIEAIKERAEPGDILALTMGSTHRPVAEALPDLIPVETGIGYSGVWAPYRVFESRAWQAFLAAKEPTDDVRLFDDVIPRAYDIADFPEGTGSGGYYLFVGRLMSRKGPHIAAEACKRMGAKLVVAGQGVEKVEPGKITCQDGTLLEGDVEYAGVIGPEERAKLMGEATALFCPTLYLEPFGGVSVEAQLTGTPAIVSPSGGLPENVREGRSGFVCQTLAEFAGAASVAGSLDRKSIRQYAQATWGTEVIGPKFGRYFARLETLQDGRGGWYA